MTGKIIPAFFGTLFLLTACSSKSEEPSKDAVPTSPVCPQFAILADAAMLTKFTPGRGKDITDIEYEAEIGGYNGQCLLKDKGRRTELTFSVMIDLSKGPAYSGAAKLEIPYFIAYGDKTKEVFTAVIEVPQDLPKFRYNDAEITMEIPLKDMKEVRATTIYMGFQLSREELEYNRKIK